MMKRFGVQLAGSGLVILLGALGVAQAQRDTTTKESSEWEQPSATALTPPPAPIAAFDAGSDDHSAQAPATHDAGAFGFPAPPAAVRTVNHEEPTQMAFASPPTSSASEAAPATASIGLPAWSTPPANDEPASGPASMPAAGFSLPDPNSALQPMQDMAAVPLPAQGPSDTAVDVGAMPTLQFDAAPSNGLRAAPESANGASDAANMAPAPLMSSPAPATPDASAAPDSSAAPAFGAAAMLPATPGYSDPSGGPTASNEAPRFGGTANLAAAPDQAMSGPASLQPEARIASLPAAPLPSLTPIDDASTEIILAEPGDRRLEGMQAPSVVIHKRAPEEVKVGKPATFVIHVQNVGSVEAIDVFVDDRVPAGMRLLDASPAPAIQGDLLRWQLGALEPGGERTVTLQLVPEQEGELGSVARVTFEAAASVRTVATRPELRISQKAPQQVLIGQQLEIELEVSNPGTGAATGVIMQEDVPDGLEHPKGRQLDNVIGTLAPGEIRRQVLRLRAVAAGAIENRIRLVGDDGLVTEDAVQIEVIAPQLSVELEGPSRRYLERQATFNVNLANVGTADATNVEVVAYLDRGFSFVGTEYQGQYDPNRHAVYWSLAELPANGKGSVPLRLLPIEQGARAIRLEAKGDLNVQASYEKNVSVDTLAQLTFSITDDADPIEVGSEATYEIRITNRGSRDDADVGMQMQLPAGLELVSSDSEASTDGKGLIAFAPAKSLTSGSEIIHRVRVRGVAQGTHVVKAIVTSSQSAVPVTKEESTMVYSDQ